jgi:protein required for attachment to host cells
MLTKLKKLFVLVMFAAFVFVLVGCKSDVEVALEGLLLPTEVQEDFTLPSATLEGAITTWASSDESVIKVDGTYAEVYRPSGADKTVKLTATVTLGEETGNKEFEVNVICLKTPDAIKIKTGSLKYDEAKQAYLLVANKSVQLEIQVADEEMSTEVRWEVSSSKRAEITADGLLTGKAYGEVKVTATSTSGAVKDEIKVIVVEATSPQEVLLNNKKAIEEQLPLYVSSDYVFPMAPNDSVETYYFDSLADRTDVANAFYYGEYAYIYDDTSVDRQETLYCLLKYEGNEIEFEFTICVVADEEENEFKALEYAKAQLDEVFKPYVGAGASKVTGNIEVPEAFSAEEALYDVELSYDVVCSFAQNPLAMAKVGEEGAEKLNAVYSKPNDDTMVRIEVYCTTANNDAVYRYNMMAAGYTKEEVVEYITANVLPQANEAGEFKLVCQNITLPSDDTTKKFQDLSIEWKSSDTAVLTDEGRFANPALAAQASVTLTATI